MQTKDEVLAELIAQHIALKKHLENSNRSWVPHDVRDQLVDFVRRWSERTEIGVGRFIHWLNVTASKFYDWRELNGCVNEQNGWVPRDFWLERREKEAIIDFHLKNPLEGYRRLKFMMLAADVVAVSPASAWRVLKQAGLLSRCKAVTQGNRFRGAAQARLTLAYRCFLYQRLRDPRSLVQRSGWVQSFDRA